ncbi:tRNA (adenosine(37)-N6)-threonylcarbamoyltransferase complex transferase subunit TsaD [Fodinisporobacter ferrooxydans]|uniref:tRNA N6-adenosine threonylcarbamoyltransferase n=1 Tax=Fodinisporobacter ferrooxydans TaxID=2901836 RepID=A0ABY4CPF5_9BACL|nr:tRNA (adenosine(37)-N6)-threonylcarbamoyltransferase complex transferase subunit TsaD [Alicyclobacillaceae bacterium MYW30-H2]
MYMGWKSRSQERYQTQYAQHVEQGQPCYILGIESSCDETSVAIVENGRRIVSNVISSQADIHKQFGGVVPEVASRRHVERITQVVEMALQQANLTMERIAAIGVTYGPGLVGALLVGVSAAKSLAYAHDLPVIAVHHIAGHIYSNFLENKKHPPVLALIVSGGHTEIVYMPDLYTYECLGRTRDDAVGEAFDKVARTMGLEYPGGPVIDRLAQKGNPEAVPLPRAFLADDSFDFSFSGLKSAVINVLHNGKQRGESISQEDLAASFQAAVTDVLVEKTAKAVLRTGVRQVVVAGGVAANQGLRASLGKRAQLDGFEVYFPPVALCTDNAAMIAGAAYPLYQKGQFADLSLNAVANIRLGVER